MTVRRTAVHNPDRWSAGLMCSAALVAAFIGIDAERKPLEEVCAPLGCDPTP